MSEAQSVQGYERKITPMERLFTRSPFSTVTMVARIRGTVTESMLRNALSKVRLRHPNLRVRIMEGQEGDPWFTSEGAGEIPIETLPRKSDDHWIPVVQDACQVPYEFEAHPAIRFILLHSATRSELVIVCHHIICDGLSLAYLTRDLMVRLGDPDRAVEPLPDPVPIGRDNIPHDVSLNAVSKFFIKRINRKWAGEKVVFDQEDYRQLSRAYWVRYSYRMLTAELSRAQTTALVERCRRKEITVNSALSAAFVGAQAQFQDAKAHHPTVAVGASLRDLLPIPAGEVMGFYAGVVMPKWSFDGGRGFWENARKFHRKVRPLFTNKKLFADLLAWFYLDPTILEAINFKKLGGLVSQQAPRYQKLSSFGARDDTIVSILKRDGLESLDKIAMGTAVTNLGRLDLPGKYGDLELERLLMKPGGSFPLTNVNLVVGAATCAGRLSLVLEFVEDNIDMETAKRIRETAVAFLLGE
jgi:hypothetical protein